MVSLRNNVNLIGRITHDLELRRTNSDIPVLNFSVAVDKPGTKKDDRVTEFFDIVAWRQSAESISKYFHKGDPIGIHGSLQNDDYTDRDGNKRKKTVVLLDTFEFMPSRKQQSEPVNDAIPEQVQVDPDGLPF